MFCPACQAVLASGVERCPSCDAALRQASAADSTALVEAEAVTLAAEPEVQREPGTAIVVRGAQGRALAPLARMTRLPALAWRRPAVRAAVKTGASAVALSLALRAARTLLAARRQAARQPAPASSLLPALADLLRAPEPSRAAGGHDRGQARVVSETIIYIRHSVRV